MRPNTHPIIYHPSNILLLDDDRKVMNLVASGLDESFMFVMKDNPREALDYLSSHTLKPSELASLIANQTFDFQNNEKVNLNEEKYIVNISALKGNLDSANRFKKIFVAVVDRHMPAMDGLEFCRLIRKELNIPVKLILLTGATSTDEAIAAFNRGEIDAFFEKSSDPEMADRINETIQKLTWQYLSEVSQQVVGLIEPQLSHIFDTNFHQQFEKIRQENETAEFYLLDSSGSFLLIDQDGKVKVFFVRKEEDFDNMYDLAKDSGAMQDVLQGFKNRQHFPFTSSGSGHLLLEGDEWNDIMVTMRKIPGRDLFYSVIDIIDPRVISFNHYRGEVWPEP